MSKRRWILTPDEALDMAKAMVERQFGNENHQSVATYEPKQVPELLPKPERVPNPKGQGVSIQQLRKAQKAEWKRKRFNRKVRKNLSRSMRKLTNIQREQIRAAKAAYRAAVRQLRAQAEAAIKRAEAARKAAEALRKQVEAMRKWLELEKARQRALNSAAKTRIREAKARGFRPLLTYCSSEQEWGASCPLFAIRGLATAAAMIWAAENKQQIEVGLAK
jgi:membrane protein involved in colicin uptake